jgi:sugar phosphate isomerase/epimerase
MKPTNKYSRRKFIEKSGASGLSLALGSSYLLSACGTKEKGAEVVADTVDAMESEAIHKISCQLYTFRRELAEDVQGTIEKVAGTGLKHVETFDFTESLSVAEGTKPLDPFSFSKILKDADLSVSSMHAEIPVGDEKAKALERAEAYNCKKMIWHGWPEDKRYQTLDGIKQLADIYNEANQFLKSNGLEFGLHNHWWEMRLDEEGGYPLQTLMEYIDKDIFLEIDTYWVKSAQRDPAKIIEKYRDHVQFMHIKDGPAPWKEDLAAEPHEPMVALGKGSQDFHAITKACGEESKWMVIELDECATDVFVAVKESVDYLTSNKMATV